MILENISKSYFVEVKEVQALKNVSFKFEMGKFYAIMGHSGSGKSTLINVLGLIENISSGKYFVDKVDTSMMNDKEESRLRMKYFGFIFQDFYLDEYLNSYENVMVPMLINNEIINKKERAIELLNQFELADRILHYPKQLSGGEKQRVAIARALSNNPNVILADEPTGNLDAINEKKVFSILKNLSNDGKCIIVVSHSNEIKKYADILLEIKDGKVVETHVVKK